MGNIRAIFWKEMRSYFGSPIAYVMAGVFLLFMGFIFRNMVLEFNQFSLTYMQQRGRFAQVPSINANDMVVTDLFGVQFFIWIIVVPMLTMRLYAEEKRTGTMELLMTSPVTTWETLLGKFSACLGLYTVIEIASFAFLGILALYAQIEWGPVWSAYLGALLLGAAFISAGLFASSLTENQIVSAVISFFTLMIFWMIDWSSRFAGPLLAKVLTQLSLLEHMRNLNRGVIDTNDVVFFLSVTVFFLFLTHTVIESRRWRQ